MKLPSIARIPLVLVLASCSLSPVAQPTASQAPPATAPTSTPTSEPTATATPTAAATQPAPTESLPPQGVLSGHDDAVDGWLGSYCWAGTCVDAPALPDMDHLPFAVGGGDLVFSLSDGSTFIGWRASYTGPEQAEHLTLGQGGERFDPDGSPSAEPVDLATATFASPPGGDWVVLLQVFLESGDLSYAWHVDVQRSPPTGDIRPRHGDNVEGQRGSWCYDNGCADLPAFPKSDLPEVRAGARDSLTFQFADGHEFGYASAGYSTDTEAGDSHELATIGEYDPDSLPTAAPPVSSFEFEGPPRGDWALVLFVRFPNSGDASYTWHLIVD